MAEAITYADLRFVKAPLKKSISTWLGQDSEAYEDGELTYENVQVPSAPEGPVGMAPPGLENKTGVKPEPPPAAWSSVTSAAAGRVIPRCAAYTWYLLLGLVLTCLLLGVAAICLGVRYLQVSQQLGQTDSFLEFTNSSLHRQLYLKITQLGHREEELRGSREKLTQNEKALQVEQGLRQSTEKQLQACESEREKTQETLRREEDQRSNLEQRISSMQNTLKTIFQCSPPEICCPVGWLLRRERCFYFSPTQRTWEDSRKYCQSLSSDLAVFKDVNYYQAVSRETIRQILPSRDDSGWVGLYVNKNWQWIDNTSYLDYSSYSSYSSYGFSKRSPPCAKIQSNWPELQPEKCSTPLPCICEMAAFRHPHRDFLHF